MNNFEKKQPGCRSGPPNARQKKNGLMKSGISRVFFGMQTCQPSREKKTAGTQEGEGGITKDRSTHGKKKSVFGIYSKKQTDTEAPRHSTRKKKKWGGVFTQAKEKTDVSLISTTQHPAEKRGTKGKTS